MSWQVLGVHYGDVLPLLGLGLACFFLRLLGERAGERCAAAALTVSGYLRRRPDPAVERAVRTAFADLDRDLAGILGDRTPGGVRDREPTHSEKR